MSSSTVRLYDALKTEYPNKVYLGQFDQSANLRSTDSVVMLEMIDQNPSYTKDLAKRDQINYKIHVVGALQKEVEQKANEIRDLIEPYNDEYIYLMKFEGIETIYEDEAETYRKVVNFICFPNQAGSNKPTDYYEHIVRFYNTDQHEILNASALNYLPISWVAFDSAATHTFTSEHTYQATDINVYAMMQMDSPLEGDIYFTASNTELTFYKEGIGNSWDNSTFLIRVRKDVSGGFVIPV